MQALEQAQAAKAAPGEFVSECPGSCGAPEPFSVGTWKGVGRLSQQTFIDPYPKVGFAKRYDRKPPLPAADLLTDRVVPFFDAPDVVRQRIRTDRGTAYWGSPERHEDELYVAVENIAHPRTKGKSPQTNGICERFQRTMLNAFSRVTFRKKR